MQPDRMTGPSSVSGHAVAPPGRIHLSLRARPARRSLDGISTLSRYMREQIVPLAATPASKALCQGGYVGGYHELTNAVWHSELAQRARQTCLQGR